MRGDGGLARLIRNSTGNLCDGIEIVRAIRRRRRGSGVISPFKAPPGISVKVEIFDLPPGGRIILAGVARDPASFLDDGGVS